MFSIFKRNIDDSLPSSSLFNEHDFYKAFSKDIRQASSHVMIESPYITNRRANEFTNLLRKLNKSLKITIYTRNPYHHDGNLIKESLEGIKTLRSAGVRVVTCNDMRHRKLAIIDKNILWEGSLNMLSQNGSREIMRRTNSSKMCRKMEQFIGLKWYSKS